jgi:hypothetical protein
MKENIIFSLYKDKPVRSAKEFRNEIERKYGKEVNAKELYLRITNYQIDKYGYMLWDYDDEYTTEDYLRRANNARNRRKQRIGK